MRLLLAALLCLGTAAHGAVKFKDANFAVELDSDWVQVSARDHVAFSSKSRNLTLRVDSVPAPLKRKTPLEAARLTLDLAVRSAQEAEGVTITSQSTSDWKNGGAMLTYAGTTQTRGRMRFVGLIVGSKFVYMQFDTRATGDKELEAAVRAVLDRFRVIQ